MCHCCLHDSWKESRSDRFYTQFWQEIFNMAKNRWPSNVRSKLSIGLVHRSMNWPTLWCLYELLKRSLWGDPERSVVRSCIAYGKGVFNESFLIRFYFFTYFFIFLFRFIEHKEWRIEYKWVSMKFFIMFQVFHR